MSEERETSDGLRASLGAIEDKPGRCSDHLGISARYLYRVAVQAIEALEASQQENEQYRDCLEAIGVSALSVIGLAKYEEIDFGAKPSDIAKDMHTNAEELEAQDE